ncbi:aminotransferase class IV [Reichenbachiella versicolor]|uniref:aminotransferase class IV n=1 Tax=Reichenbachiella versicolor TaxID=1821036 RepID=UPI000D6DC81F|nr:aminotransferase class IV [Reichenbachiella versicolor]
MFQFVETICIQDGQPKLLKYHQARLNWTWDNHFNGSPFVIDEILLQHIMPKQGRYKCRFLYNASEFRVQIEPYVVKPVFTLKLVEGKDMSYSYKSLSRTLLTELYSSKGKNDDIIIVNSKGELTDSYFANLAFYDGEGWYTPNTYLLKGVKRSFLIDRGILKEIKILKSNLQNFSKVSLINALLNLGELEIDIESIYN